MSHVVHLGDCLEVLGRIEPSSIDSLVTDPPAGISFMGKDWDSDKGGREQWIAWMREVMKLCHAALKPGAHGLIWALPRTSHWTATALEDAGFEVRDVLTHLFGQGFPKSMNIAIAIDKASGAMGPRGKAFVTAGAGDRKDIDGTAGLESDPGHNPITDAAKQWQGWGTALKPASEHWILVRKPLSEKTVAANVQKRGTGGINIDGSRIEATRPATTYSQPDIRGNAFNSERDKRRVATVPENLGRFPANLILSHSPYCGDDQCDIECAIRQLDEQASSHMKIHAAGNKRTGVAGKTEKSMFGIGSTDAPVTVYTDSDSSKVSRFFYCAKISSGERNEAGQNKHPTVKPQKLMRYLCKLVTAPGGTILDPFAGSGSTGVAAVLEGFSFVGIEREPEYVQIAEKRIYHALPKMEKKYHTEDGGGPDAA